jgi:chromosome segregation ATPase
MPTKGNNNVDDSAKTEGAGWGALVAGVTTAAAAFAATGDLKKSLGIGILGAAIGGAAGYAWGNEVYKRQVDFANTEDFLNYNIKLAVQDNEKLANDNQALEKQIVQLNTEIKTLQANYKKGQTTKKELQAQKSEVKKQLAQAQEVRKHLQKRVKAQQQVIQEANAQKRQLAAKTRAAKKAERVAAKAARKAAKQVASKRAIAQKKAQSARVASKKAAQRETQQAQSVKRLKDENRKFQTAVKKQSRLVGKLQALSTSDALGG